MISAKDLRGLRRPASETPGMDRMILDTASTRYVAIFDTQNPDLLYALSWRRKGSSMEPESRDGLPDLRAVAALINELEGSILQ